MRFLFCFLALLFVFSAPSLAQECEGITHQKPGHWSSCKTGGVEDMIVENVYTYPTSEKQKNGAAFMTLKNMGDKDLRVVAAHTDVAEKAELHVMNMEGDIMHMREVEGFDIPAHGQIVLEPSGSHVMLMGLARQFVLGSGFVLFLKMDDGQEYVVNVPVKGRGGEAVHEEHSHP